MRRMKIRAVPNVGSGGNLQRVNLPRTKPPDGESTTQSVTEPSKEKNYAEGTCTLPVQSVAGASSKSETVSNIAKERKTAITIELDSCDEKPSEVEIDRPSCNTPDDIYVSKNCNTDKICSDVEILPKFSSKKLPEADDEVQEVAVSESIQCLGAYKRHPSPHMPSSSSKDPSSISRNAEITLDNESECPALSVDTTKNSVSDSSKSNLMSPKHKANPLSPASDVDCLIDNTNKGKSDIMDSRNKDVVIVDDKVMSSEDGKNVINLGSDKVFIGRGKSVEKSLAGMGTLARRPKIRAKPSFSSNLGKKPLNHNRKEVNLKVTPVVNSYTEDVILEEGDGEKDNLSSKIKDVIAIKDGNEIGIQAPQNLVAKSREITLDDSNERKPASSQEVLIVNDEENNESPRGFHGTSFQRSALDKEEKSIYSALDTSQEKSSLDTVHSHTEDVILEEGHGDNDHSLAKTKQATPIKDRKEIKIPVAKSQEITLDGGNETKPVSNKEVLIVKDEENNGNPRVHSGTLVGKSGLDKGEKTMSSAFNTVREKSSPNVVGPSVRRRKISAKPSLVKCVGRKQTGVVDSSKISNMKKEINEDKEVSCLTLGEISSKIGTIDIEEKKTKQVNESESSPKHFKEIKEVSCLTLGESSSKTGTIDIEEKKTKQGNESESSAKHFKEIKEVSCLTPGESSSETGTTEIEEEKTKQVNENGSSFRRRKISAKPSLVKCVGRKQTGVVDSSKISNMKKEIHQDKEVSCLTLDESSSKIGTLDIEEKKTKQVNESESSAKHFKEIKEVSCLTPGESSSKTGTTEIEEEKTKQVNENGSSFRRRKISAKPSLVKCVGRKQTGFVDSSKISNLKKEINQDKEVSCLTIDESSSKIGTLDIEEKKTKQVNENERSAKRIKEIEEVSCLTPGESSSKTGTPEIEEEKTKQVNENESSAKKIKEIIQEDSCNALSSVPIENEFDLPRCTEDTTSNAPLKLSESDFKGNVSHISSENSSPGQFRTTKSEVQVTSVVNNNMRRSRIRAKPSLFTKRKTLQVDTQQDLVEVRNENEVEHSVDNQAQARLLAEKVSDEKVEDNENNKYLSQAMPDDVSSQTQARILSEKISDEKSSVNKIEKNTDYCESFVDEKCNSKEATESLDSVCKSSLIVKKRQFTDGGDNFDTKIKKGTQHNRKKPDMRELVVDDSGGNKENSSKCLSGKAVKRERKVPTYSKSKSKLLQLDSEEKKLVIKSERKLNASDNSDSESEESLQKKVFRERKEKFRKKLSQSQGNIERGQMTMFDLIFWNPIKNPMPGRTDINKKKDNLGSAGDGDDAASDIVEEQMVDDLGLESKSVAEESRPNSPGSAKDEVQISNEDCLSPKSNQLAVEKCEEEESEKKDEKSDEESESVRDVFAPQVKIGPNGQIILDEQSIKIQTTAAKNRDEILSKAEVVEESNDTAHYGKWNKKRRRSCEWTMKETARFYKALSTVGTDFSLMETLFTWRSRAELKTKFKKEERNNRELVDRALKDCTQFDFTPFDEESDYDPEEDRKASRIAERAEAKRKRLEMKQLQKEEEKLQKKMLAKENKQKIKQRKVVMRKMKNQIESEMKAKGTAETDQLNDETDRCSDANDSDVEFEPVKSRLKTRNQDPVKTLPRKKSLLKSGLKNGDQDSVKDLPKPKKRRVLKKQRPKIRKSSSPLEISEVTVTMETVKSQKSEHTVPVTDVTGCEMTVCEDVSILESAELQDQRKLDKHNPDITTASVSSEQMNENCAHRSSSSEIKNTIGSSKVSVISSLPEDFTESESISGDSAMWDIPLSAVKVDEDGTRSVSIPTENGDKVVPVPHLPPGTSNVLVVATKAVGTPGEYIYHVYTISPLSQE